eukprot:10116428-Heterocapsa_arctica.AAC.1
MSFLSEIGLTGDLRLRSDGEPAIVAVFKAIAAARGLRADGEPLTVLEDAPNKSSASLGGAERFAETLGGL